MTVLLRSYNNEPQHYRHIINSGGPTSLVPRKCQMTKSKDDPGLSSRQSPKEVYSVEGKLNKMRVTDHLSDYLEYCKKKKYLSMNHISLCVPLIIFPATGGV